MIDNPHNNMVADAEAFLDSGPSGPVESYSSQSTAPGNQKVQSESEAEKVLNEALHGDNGEGHEQVSEDDSELADQATTEAEDENETPEQDEGESDEDGDPEAEQAEGSESQRAKLRRQRREAQERAKTLEAQLQESEKNFEEIQDHAQYFAGRFSEVQGENEHLRAELESLRNRLKEFDIPEYESVAARELAEARRELARVRGEQTQVQARAEAQRKAQAQARAMETANAIAAAAKDFGVPPKNVFETMQIVRQTGETITPKEAARRYATLSGAKSKRQAAEAQASANHGAPHTPAAKGKSGITGAGVFGNDLDGAERFLESLAK